jgi:hypothetical protein
MEGKDMKRIGIVAIAATAVLVLFAVGQGQALAKPNGGPNGPSATVYHPVTPSQTVACNQVDNALAKIPHGDGVSPVTDAEVGPGGWRFSNGGGSFVTFANTLNDNGTPADPSDDYYDVVAGRSNVAGNAGIINDYPAFLDLPQSPEAGAIVFSHNRGEIVLTGDTSNDPPLFKLPGQGAGQVRINLHDSDKDGVFEGCAESPLLKNFGVVVQEGGDYVQQEYFKAYAEVDDSGTVTFFEWTEVSTFKNVTAAN